MLLRVLGLVLMITLKPLSTLNCWRVFVPRLRPRESRQLVVSIGDIVMDMDGRTVRYHWN